MAPPKKKPKMMDSPPVTMSKLTKHRLPLDDPISPAAVCSNRVAIAALPGGDASQYEVFLASGTQVYQLTAQRWAHGFQGERGKEGVYIPEIVQQVPSVAPLAQLAQRTEIQDLQLFESCGEGGSAVLTAADCYGRVVLAHCRRPTAGEPLQVQEASTLQPQDLLREAGWAGVAVAPEQPSQVALARHFAKDVTLFDGPVIVRTIHTMYCPTAVQLLSTQLAASSIGGPLVAVAEGPQVSLWDVRGAGRGARVAKLSPGPQHGPFYCLAASDDGVTPLIGAAGVDRSVLVWDPRTWKMLDRWSNCSKYEITGLHFSSTNPHHAIVGGMDYEMLCGTWEGNKASRLGGGNRTGISAGGASGGEDGGGPSAADAGRGVSFRGDSKWVGVAKAWRQDVVAGITMNAHLYVAELA